MDLRYKKGLTMKVVTLQIYVRVDETVSDQSVAQQIGDAIDPDSWNWDVSFPEVTNSKKGH